MSKSIISEGSESATAQANEDGSRLQELAQRVLATAKRLGADATETAVSRGQGFTATVRMGSVETVEHNRDKSLVVTVYFGSRTGSASTSDFSVSAVEDTVRAACSIAKYTAVDEYSGLADPDRLATEFKDLDLDHPWHIDVAQAIEIANECEDAARQFDARIKNSEGASVSTQRGTEVYANTHGFIGSTSGTRHSISCSVIGESNASMQRDYWYSTSRDYLDLETAQAIGQKAARRTVGRLGASKIKTIQCPVLFEAPVASSLLAHLIGAIRGSALYRKASFLLDQLGNSIFSDDIYIGEKPHLLKAAGSANYDAEGVATETRDIVQAGVLASYVLNTYSARKLGMKTTGNAGGVRNLYIKPGSEDLTGLMKKMGTGLLVTELIGSGVNTVTGDYSRGAVGYWVENGEIRQPVEEVTVAGNLKDMFKSIVEVGSDIDTRGNIRCGSILLEQATVAGD